MQYPYLISRVADPLLGITIGAASYYLYERRNGRETGHTLNELISRKLESSHREVSHL